MELEMDPTLQLDRFMCRIVDSTFIVQGVNRSDKRAHSDRWLPIHQLYSYQLFDSTVTSIDVLLEPETECIGLDYSREAQRFLFSGFWKDRPGFFLLDSSFEEVQDITAPVKATWTLDGVNLSPILSKHWRARYAQFLNDRMIVVQDGTGMVCVDIRDSSWYELCDNCWIEAQSHDRTFALISCIRSGNSGELATVDLQKGSEPKSLGVLDKGDAATFSPDSHAAAYVVVEDRLFDYRYRIWIVDLESGRKTKTPLVLDNYLNDGSVIWVEERHSNFVDE
jgi:hypothetical protein